MKILVVGHMQPGSNSRSLADGFMAAGHEVRFVDTSLDNTPRVGSPLWMSKRWLGRVTPGAEAKIQSDIRRTLEGFEPDLLVAVKTIFFDQDALLGIKARCRIHISFDDVSNPDNLSQRYLDAEPGWDAIVTTKRHNVPELEARGASQVLLIQGAYDPTYQRVVEPFQRRRHVIGFIGAARPDRYDLPLTLAEKFPNQGIVYGPRWKRRYPRNVEGVEIRPEVTLSRYTAAANSIRMGIVLLNSENRDTHTMRSYETPACGQLFIGQRTAEHSSMLDEGEEALFFDSMEDLWSQAGEIVKDAARMEKIATAGYRRIVRGANTYRHRAIEIAEAVRSL